MNFWEGKRIRLRAMEPGDAATFYEWNQDRERARNLDFLWPPSSLASVEAWTADQALKTLENGRFLWVIESLDGTPVGSIDTHHSVPRNGTFSYGIAIAREHRRKGYAREAISMVLRYYFEELRYQKCTVEVHGDNEASRRLHERMGFELEGVQRRMIYARGRYLDLYWYGMTSEEFETRYGPSGR